MNIRTPSPAMLTAEQLQDDVGERTASASPSVHPLLLRIATALQVPLSSLAEPPNPIGATASIAATAPTDDAMAAECLGLVRAYKSISDPAERLRLFDLVRQAGEQS